MTAAGTAATATAAGWWAEPRMGLAMFFVEITIIFVVGGAALFGSERVSERAFRLLRFAANRSEPTSLPGRRRPLRKRS